MADSGITKRALASSLKELMNERPLSKISISDICRRCEMNRKSFYYHFHDKNDLINWIFDSEFVSTVTISDYKDRWDAIEALLSYLYENRKFYRKVLKENDQNCFRDHFSVHVTVYIRKRLPQIIGMPANDFCVEFFTDAFVLAIVKWLTASECVYYKTFSDTLRSCIYMTAVNIAGEKI